MANLFDNLISPLMSKMTITYANIAAGLILICLSVIGFVSGKGTNLPNNIVWVGKKEGIFSEAQSKLWAFVCGRQVFFEAYSKVL